MLAFVQLARWIYISFSRISISYLPGPSKTDWLLGNLPDLNFGEVGVAHLAWQKKFGTTFKFHGLIGVRISNTQPHHTLTLHATGPIHYDV